MENDLQSEFIQFDTEFKELCEKHGVKVDIAIEFPIYREIPEEAKFALYLFHKYGGVLKPKYTKVNK